MATHPSYPIIFQHDAQMAKHKFDQLVYILPLSLILFLFAKTGAMNGRVILLGVAVAIPLYAYYKYRLLRTLQSITITSEAVMIDYVKIKKKIMIPKDRVSNIEFFTPSRFSVGGAGVIISSTAGSFPIYLQYIQNGDQLIAALNDIYPFIDEVTPQTTTRGFRLPLSLLYLCMLFLDIFLLRTEAFNFFILLALNICILVGAFFLFVRRKRTIE